MRGLRLRAATGGCKIPGANMTAKERARQAGIRRNPPSQTGTRKHVPPYGNARTIRRQRVPDRRPLSRRLAALHAFLEKKPRAAARQNAKSTSRILGARKRKRHPECARPEQLPHIPECRPVNDPATGTSSSRTSGPNAKKPFPRHSRVAGKASRRQFSTPLLSYVHLVEQIAAPPTLSIRKST